jgi:hypothetical protein
VPAIIAGNIDAILPYVLLNGHPPSPQSVKSCGPSGSRSVEKRMVKNEVLRYGVIFTPEIAQLLLGDLTF